MKKFITLLIFLFLFTLISFSQTFHVKNGSVHGEDCVVLSFKNNTKESIHIITVNSIYVHPKHGRTMRNYEFRVNLHPGQEIKGNPFVNEHRLMISEGGYKLDVDNIKVTFGKQVQRR